MGGVWRLLGPLGSSLELFFSCLYSQWSSKVVLEASGLDFGSIPCAAHVPPRCKEVTKCQCECHAGIPAAISASPSKIVAKTAPELAKTQPGGAQDHPKSSTEAPMRAQMRPRAPKKHPKGGQETAQRHPRESKSFPRASKLRRRQAQDAPKPFQKRAWGLPKQAWGMILVRSFSQKAPTAIFCYFWRRTPKPLNSR